MSDSNILQVRNSPLHLEGYFIKKLSFSVSDDMDNESLSALVLKSGFHPYFADFSIDTSLKFNMGFQVSGNADDSSRYKFILNIKSVKGKDIKQVYDFEIEIVAFFSWMAETSIPQLEKTIQTSAIMLMYASAREALASATARSPFPALVLPTTWLNFASKEDKSTVKTGTVGSKKIPAKNSNKTRKASKKS